MSTSSADGSVCGFCLDDFDPEPSVELVCGHKFHEACLQEYHHYRVAHAHRAEVVEWACPICRSVYAVTLPTEERDSRPVNRIPDNAERQVDECTCAAIIMLVKTVITLELIGAMLVMVGFVYALHQLYMIAVAMWVAASVMMIGIIILRLMDLFNRRPRMVAMLQRV